MTAWLLFRRHDHRHGRAPWPGPHLGPAGRPEGPHATDARAGPSAGGYGSAPLFLISPGQPPISGSRWRAAGPCWPGSLGNGTNCGRREASPEGACRVEHPGAATCHPKVLPGRLGGRCQGIRPSCRARATASVRLAAPSLPRTCVTCSLTVSSATNQVVADALVGPARGEQPRHLQLAVGQSWAPPSGAASCIEPSSFLVTAAAHPLCRAFPPRSTTVGLPGFAHFVTFASSVGSQNSGDRALCPGSGWEEGQRGDYDDGADDHGGPPGDRQAGIGRASGNSGSDPVDGYAFGEGDCSQGCAASP